MAYQTSSRYKQVIYSEDAKHKIKIWFDDVELQDADNYCEKLSVSSRIIPNGSKRFSLDNLISKELTLILRNVPIIAIKDQVRISLGTFVDNDYEYVPLGIFNIQDSPVTDKDKITIKLRDNSVKLDFGYNAQPLIEQYGGSVTKLQIHLDICQQAGINTKVQSFDGCDELVGVWDNTINARIYEAYLAESSGKIPVIDRDGELDYVSLKNLVTHTIPIYFVEKFQDGEKYKIGRVVYEDAIRKFESGSENDGDTLYINSGNPYIVKQGDIDRIYDNVVNFEINSFKTGKVFGDPAIDPWDLISITKNGVTYTTLATNDFTYNGVFRQTFDTQIGIEAKEENVTLNGEPTFKKWAKTKIDNIEGNIELTVGRIESVENTQNNNYNEIINKFNGYTPTSKTLEIEQSVTQLQTNTYTKTEINTKLIDGSVKKIQTTSGTFDENGMTYEKTNSQVKSTINQNGVGVYPTSGYNNDSLLFAGYVDENNTQYADYKGQTIVGADNMIVEHYLVVGSHSRFEDYYDDLNNKENTAMFYIE